MLTTPIRKSSFVIAVASSLIFLLSDAKTNRIDHFFSAELFFTAWLYVLLFLLTIMIASIFPLIRFSSDNWHRPSLTISTLAIFQEPINFMHYVAVTLILSSLLGAGLSGLVYGNAVYPIYFLATGVGILGGIRTAPWVFKGNFAANNK